MPADPKAVPKRLRAAAEDANDREAGRELATDTARALVAAPSSREIDAAMQRLKRKGTVAAYGRKYLTYALAKKGLSLEYLCGVLKEIVDGGEKINASTRLNGIRLAFQAAGLVSRTEAPEERNAAADIVRGMKDDELVQIVTTVRKGRDMKAVDIEVVDAVEAAESPEAAEAAEGADDDGD